MRRQGAPAAGFPVLAPDTDWAAVLAGTRCYIGVSVADRSEYSILSGNSFAYCRLAIWNSSGNWTVNDNSMVGCYGACYSFARTGPYASLTSGNWNHGTLSGNTFNHSNGGARALWSANAAVPIGGSAL